MVPKLLAEKPNWICWRNEMRHGRPTKIPYAPKTGTMARSNDPRTWTDLATAQKVSRRYTGIGFVFRAGEGLAGIDIDKCVKDGEISPVALQIMDACRSW